MIGHGLRQYLGKHRQQRELAAVLEGVDKPRDGLSEQAGGHDGVESRGMLQTLPAQHGVTGHRQRALVTGRAQPGQLQLTGIAQLGRLQTAQ